MLEAYGSKDDLEDIVGLLDRTGAHYVLAVMIPGETQTIMHTNLNKEYAVETGHNVLDFCKELAKK